MDIGKKLKQKRQELGLTQQEVADKVFVTRQTISKWELGKSRPDLISLKLMEELLQEEFLERPEKRKQMKITKKDILMTVVFGVVFLPIRFLITLIKPHINLPIIKYVLIPVSVVVVSLYLRSLNTEAFSVVWVFLLCTYFPIVGYYSRSESTK